MIGKVKVTTTPDLSPLQLVAGGFHRTADGELCLPNGVVVGHPNGMRWFVQRVLAIEALAADADDPDEARRRQDFTHAGGDALCDGCLGPLVCHPHDPIAPFLRIRCDRSRVKL